jgi:hypothetical protein
MMRSVATVLNRPAAMRGAAPIAAAAIGRPVAVPTFWIAQRAFAATPAGAAQPAAKKSVGENNNSGLPAMLLLPLRSLGLRVSAADALRLCTEREEICAHSVAGSGSGR